MKAKIIDINGTKIALKFGFKNQLKYEQNFGKSLLGANTADFKEIPKLIYAGQTDTNLSLDEIYSLLDDVEKPFNEIVLSLADDVTKAMYLSFTGSEEPPKESGTEKN